VIPRGRAAACCSMASRRSRRGSRSVGLIAVGQFAQMWTRNTTFKGQRMSEYQYYEFQAIDRPLTSKQQDDLRKLSTRAVITPTSFTNEYQWGDFRGNPRRMIEQCFDAFFYYANWGTHWFMLRLPKKLVDIKTIKEYAADHHLDIRTKGDFVVLDFQSEDESGEWYGDEEKSGLASLIPLRADLLNGDLRSLYLGWLAAAQDGALAADDVEPPVPPGLQRLSASLESLAEFLRIDDKLLKAAGKAGAAAVDSGPAKEDLAKWVAKLPAAEKNKILLQLAEGNDPHLSLDLLRRFRESRGGPSVKKDAEARQDRRTVGELLAAAGLDRETMEEA
jgi:hypothetical protein